MYSRDDVNLCSQRTDLCDGTAVRTLVILEDHLANGLFLILVNRLAKNCKPLFFFCESLFQLVCDKCDVVLSCLDVYKRQDLNHALCFLHILIVYTADRYSTLVCDVDLHACALDNGCLLYTSRSEAESFSYHGTDSQKMPG